MAGRIILLRHGQTSSNVSRRLDTRPPGAELTELGREQAADVGRELAEFLGAGDGKPGSLVRVVSSVAIRAQQTAMLATRAFEQAAGMPAHSLPVDVVPGIHEIYAGELEMRNDWTASDIYNKALRGWMHGDVSASMPGGETLEDVLSRYRPVVERLASAVGPDGAHEGGDIVVVSHGAVIRTLATHSSPTDPQFALDNRLANCRFIVLEPGGRPFGEWSVARWGDVGASASDSGASGSGASEEGGQGASFGG